MYKLNKILKFPLAHLKDTLPICLKISKTQHNHIDFSKFLCYTVNKVNIYYKAFSYFLGNVLQILH